MDFSKACTLVSPSWNSQIKMIILISLQKKVLHSGKIWVRQYVIS